MMIDFGYKISQDQQIDFDKTDKRIMLYLEAAEPSVKLCISCGSCTATCTAGNFTDFNFRKIQALIRSLRQQRMR